MKRIAASIVAVAVLIAGGFAVAMLNGNPAIAQESDTQDDAESTKPDRSEAFDEVFEQLVADGVITEDQADTVQAALQAKAEELKAEREARREERRAQREQIRSFLEDGVIDAGELAQLGSDHPLNDPDGPAAEYLDDGELTAEELRELRPGRGRFGLRGTAPAEGANAASTSV